MNSEQFYGCPVDFVDIAQMTIYRCEGVQQAMREAIDQLGARAEIADDGVILGFWSEAELTEEQLAVVTKNLHSGFENYLRTK